MNREIPSNSHSSSHQRIYSRLNTSTQVLSTTEIHPTVVPANVKSLGNMSVVIQVQFICGSPKCLHLLCLGPFAPWCDVDKTDPFPDEFQSKEENPELRTGEM